VIIPLFGVGIKGKSPAITAQHRINCYQEIQKEDDKTRIALIATPGESLFTAFGDTPARGMIAVGDLLYVVHRGTFWEVNNAGTRTSRGTLNTTSGKVSMATNGAQIVIVDGTNGYTYTIATTTFAEITDGDFPDTAGSVTWGGQYFIISYQRKFYISAVNDGTSWDALDFATAESSPDDLVRVLFDHGELLLFGAVTTEPWGITGAADFPFSAIQGAAKEFGLAAKWSLVKYDDSLAGLMKNKLGQVQVMKMQGYNFVPISSPELDSIINGYATVSDATAYAYMLGGHPMLQISFPSVSKTWEYDGLTSALAGFPVWHERQSGLTGGRHRGEIQCDYVNKTRISDYENGNIYTIDSTLYAENGDSYPMEVVSKHLMAQYNYLTVDKLFLDFEAGVGLATGQGSDPQVMLQVSRDGGRTWGAEQWRSIGKVGEYKARAEWRGLGTCRDFVFKIRVSDPVKRVLVNAAIVGDMG
jgi:hypothetical protein